MCGIAGVISWDGRFRVDHDALEKMARCVAHRGPDSHGAWINHDREPSTNDPQAALAHHRLKVIDLDPRSDQPMSDGRGRHIVYNGEIYNYRELRQELASLRPDYPWRTAGDTEVLLVGYDAWKEKCVDHLNGMFAFAIWDENDKTLFLARDRMGQKPLYFMLLGGRDAPARGIAFASELTALRALRFFDDAIDQTALELYLRWGYIPAPRTIYESAEKLPPGCFMRIGPTNSGAIQYFEPNEPDAPAHHPRDPRELARRTRELVTQAVKRQLVADVPLGCFLSGGMDSSIMAAAMKASVQPDQPVLTFSIGFEDRRYDETAYAALVARHLGTEHRAFVVRPDAAEDLPRLAATFGEPFADSSALPTHYLSRETRKHVTVALSGDGGDELFAGYDRYVAMYLSSLIEQMPPLRHIARWNLWQHMPGTHPKNPLTRAKRLLDALGLEPARRYDAYVRIFSESWLDELLVERQRTDFDPASWLVDQFKLLRRDRDVVQAALAVDRVTYLPGDLLFKVDACSMLHALEVRSPFMDHELVSFASSLWTGELLNVPAGPGKRLLRQAFAPDLPNKVLRRKKQGFGVPVGQWFNTSLRPMLNDLLFASDSFACTRFRKHVIQRLIDEHAGGRADHTQRLYALLMLELWWRNR